MVNTSRANHSTRKMRPKTCACTSSRVSGWCVYESSPHVSTRVNLPNRSRTRAVLDRVCPPTQREAIEYAPPPKGRQVGRVCTVAARGWPQPGARARVPAAGRPPVRCGVPAGSCPRDSLDCDARMSGKRSGVAKRRPRHPLPRPRTRSQKPTRPLACTTPPTQSPPRRWPRSGTGSRWGEASGACTATATNPPTIPHRPTLATRCNEAGSGCPAARHAAAVWRRQASIKGL